MEGSIIIISGFSGAGKGTLMKQLIKKYPKEYALSISATTRMPREGEMHGREYFFISERDFVDMIENNQLLEYARYVNHYYGTPRSYVEAQLQKGRNVLLEIEIQGADKIKKMFPDTKRIFVSTADAETLYNRLKGRDTESDSVIQKRMTRAIEEAEGIETYDYLVINDDLEQTTERIHQLIMNDKHDHRELNEIYTTNANKEFINKMREELICFLKGDLK